MSLFIKLRNFLYDPRLKGVDVNSDELLLVHKRILQEKKMMKKVFSDFYSSCIQRNKKWFSGEGTEIEIGAGVSFFKTMYPHIIATDIKKSEGLDRVLDALNMDIESNTVRAIYGINCFHHFPNPSKFFNELERVLIHGGGCILIEPHHGWLASKFYKKLFDTECFDTAQESWENNENTIMTGANQALSYIVFVRDKALFSKKFPNLEIVEISPLTNYLHYLLSGGLNFRSLVPFSLRFLIVAKEFILWPFRNSLALHKIIVIRKK